MAKRKQNPVQYRFSYALAILMLLLVLGYFVQSFLEVRKVKPVLVAMERISEKRAASSSAPAELSAKKNIDEAAPQ